MIIKTTQHDDLYLNINKKLFYIQNSIKLDVFEENHISLNIQSLLIYHSQSSFDQSMTKKKEELIKLILIEQLICIQAITQLILSYLIDVMNILQNVKIINDVFEDKLLQLLWKKQYIFNEKNFCIDQLSYN
ncbi:unnamed protein product [Paramecium sonneborni]|uniref:Uncharacterized protein n=1 Tax=Paramecium sonneborni TaxID=65129 RepID=A0A8S1QPK7_9CILI|nr:unnamed protein product [Paramecium sonneborni]